MACKELCRQIYLCNLYCVIYFVYNSTSFKYILTLMKTSKNNHKCVTEFEWSAELPLENAK